MDLPDSFRARWTDHGLVARVDGERPLALTMVGALAALALGVAPWIPGGGVVALTAGPVAAWILARLLTRHEVELSSSEVRLSRRFAGVLLRRIRLPIEALGPVEVRERGGAARVLRLSGRGEVHDIVADAHSDRDLAVLIEVVEELRRRAGEHPPGEIAPIPDELRALVKPLGGVKEQERGR